MSNGVWIGMDVISAGAVGAAVRQVNRRLDPQKVPLMGVTAAFIFAAQMINVRVGPGVSGHLMGGLLAAVLLGPAPAVVVMATVLVVQCLLFSDGGLLALGANIFNLGVVATIGGYAVYQLLGAALERTPPLRNLRFSAPVAVAAWVSVMLSAFALSLELALSGRVPLQPLVPTMMSVHVLVGIGEAVVTVAAVTLIRRTRPGLLESGR